MHSRGFMRRCPCDDVQQAPAGMIALLPFSKHTNSAHFRRYSSLHLCPKVGWESRERGGRGRWESGACTVTTSPEPRPAACMSSGAIQRRGSLEGPVGAGPSASAATSSGGSGSISGGSGRASPEGAVAPLVLALRRGGFCFPILPTSPLRYWLNFGCALRVLCLSCPGAARGATSGCYK